MMPSSRFTPHASRPTSPTGSQRPTTDPASLQLKTSRLEEIQNALALADQIEKLSEQMDEAQSRLSELKRKRERHEVHTQELKQLLAKQAAYEGFSDMPKNASNLLDEYQMAEKTHAQELRELDEQKREVEDQIAMIPATPIFLSRLFLTGIGVMILSLLLAFLLSLKGVWQTLYVLGLLLGAGLVAVSVFLDVRRLTQRKTIENKRDELSHAKESFEARFKKQNTIVFDLIKKTACQNADQLKDKIRNYEELLQSIQHLKEEQSRLLGGKSLNELEREHQTYSVAAKELESKIKGIQGAPADIYSLQEEMRMIQREIEDHQTLKAKPNVAAENGESADQTAPQKSGPSAPWLPPSKGLEAIPKRQLETLATSWLRRLTQGRYDRIAYDSLSNLTLIGQNGKPAPLEQLSSGVRDLVYLSILWAGWQFTSHGTPSLPLILDEPFVGLDESGRRVAVEALKELGQNRQIILLTTASHPIQDNLHLIELG